MRCRRDRRKFRRYKTIEPIIEEKDSLPETGIPAVWRVCFRIGYGERELHECGNRAGGYRNPDQMAWHLEYH